jgi:hypothetical protein
MFILVGLENPDLYVSNVENNIGTTNDTANKITNEVIQKIFIPISNALVENIKKSGIIKRAKPEQNVDFILSGGDYSAFVEPIFPSPSQGEGLGVRSEEKTTIPVFSIGKENLKE